MSPRAFATPLASFEDKYTPEPNTGCWLWTASVGKVHGYGHFHHADCRERRAHRAAYVLLVGPIPDGMFVCHRCDQPSCVNPSHLFLGTPADNMTDKRVKGRSAKGEGVANAKLSTASVRGIRALRAAGLTHRQIASRFNVCRSVVTLVLANKAWTHVEVA